MLNFDGKVVLITGAKSGIGATSAELFIKQGAKVIGVDIGFAPSGYDEIDFEKNPVQVHLDVTDLKQVKEIINIVKERFNRIDVVVNSAGILTTTPILEITEEQWDRVFAINLKGTFFMCQAALKHMIEKKGGCIVNLSSVSGKIGGIMAGADYSASKAAVICLTKSFARAGAVHGIRVNCIAPAAIHTPMLEKYYKDYPEEVLKKSMESKPLKRWGEPIEVASTIVFLASREASYITGECVDVNGGMLMD
ncbi:MAG: SDR family oxidoreductase [Deltaproteobacteria bacterium]|nr:SDR family oxidoreductase [Deltaproteobacteria bacterium]MBW1961848.1 SDR family oxidoreductase [Deltaproteobacteria bacterium]MBW2153253.1 SDR family oxidoreductase [Deltaproteobacteria bacterium]